MNARAGKKIKGESWSQIVFLNSTFDVNAEWNRAGSGPRSLGALLGRRDFQDRMPHEPHVIME